MSLRLTCPTCRAPMPLEEPLPLAGDRLRCGACGYQLVVSWPDGLPDKLRAQGRRFRDPSATAVSAEGSPSPAEVGAAPARPREAAVPPLPPAPPPGRLMAASPTAARAAGLRDGVDVRAGDANVDPAGADDFADLAPRPTRRQAAPTFEPDPPAGDEVFVRFPGDGPAADPALDPRELANEEDEEDDAATVIMAAPIRPLEGPQEGPQEGPPEARPAQHRTSPPATPATPARAQASAAAPPLPPASQPPARPAPAASKPAQNPSKPPEPQRAQAAPAAAPPPSRAKSAPPSPPASSPWPRRLALAAGGLLVLGLGSAVAGYAAIHAIYGPELPSVEALRQYRPATVTTLFAHDPDAPDGKGRLLGEIFEQRRYVMELDQIPQHVQDAFVAAEDASFWEHGGIDYMGIVRAMGRNLAAGRVAQGGSTITQQVAKNFLLTSDRRLDRKIKEALLSWRIEEAYDKDRILYLYLNEIFLGSQAYGVEAAARTFFGKSVTELSLGEAAIIAGLPPRPSRWNPHADLDAARGRQRYVLDQLVKVGKITAAEADAAYAAPVEIVPRGANTFREVAPWFTEHVRRQLVETYGEDRVIRDGLTAITTCDLRLQDVAQAAVAEGVRDVDERMGLRREALEHLSGDALAERRKAHAQALADRGLPLAPGDVVEGIITEVAPKWVRVAIGPEEGVIPLPWLTWAYPPDPGRSWRYRVQDDLTRPVDADGDGKPEGGILRPGDVVRVAVMAASPREPEVAKAFRGTPFETSGGGFALQLRQRPEVEAALLSMDLRTGVVTAMVGGHDFEASQFNRAIQSYRQVGSTFKPIVYAAALETKRITTATILPDAPLALGTGKDEVWKPSNYGDDFLGNITLRKALALSRNTITVRALDIVDPGMGTGVVSAFARKLGIGGPPTHQLPPDWKVTPETDHLCPWLPETPEMKGFCPDRWPPRPDGMERAEHLEALSRGELSHQCRFCDLSLALGSASLTMEELVRAYAVFGSGGRWIEPTYLLEVRDRDGRLLERHEPAPGAQVLDPGLASITTWLLTNVVDGGTAFDAKRALGLHLAGKTGTTNDEKDAWFVGFSPDVITAVWVGFDQPRSLGVSSTGGRTALPIWIDFMREAAPKSADRPFEMAGDVSWALIDEESGRRVTAGGRSYPFLPGTVPEETGIAAGQATLDDLATEL